MLMHRTFLMLLAGMCLLAANRAPADSSLAASMMLRQNAVDNCARNLQTIYASLVKYAGNNRGGFPVPDNLPGLAELASCGLDSRALFCAGRKGKIAKNWSKMGEKSCSYLYFGGFSLKSAKLSMNLPLVCDKPGGQHLNVLLIDGSVITLGTRRSKDKITSCRMLVESLNAAYQYPQQLLEALRLKAAAMDNAK